jgi:hypothetical protein
VPYVLYRAIRKRQARLGDFWSDFAHGEEPFPSQLKQPIRWTGISTFSDLNRAEANAIAFGRGNFLAQLNIPDDADALVTQTGRRDPTLHSVMATPSTLLSFVAQVLPMTQP